MSRADSAQRRREQILSAACEAIADRGLQCLRLSDVAARAGVSSGTIHYYFDTKRDVVTAAFALNYERSLQGRHDLLSASETDPRTTLRALVDSYLPVDGPSTTAWRVWAELWSEGMRDAELQAVNARLYGQWRDLVRDLISAGQAAGTIVAGDAGELADVIVALVDGLSIQHLMNSPAMPLSTVRARVDAHLDSLSE